MSWLLSPTLALRREPGSRFWESKTYKPLHGEWICWIEDKGGSAAAELCDHYDSTCLKARTWGMAGNIKVHWYFTVDLTKLPKSKRYLRYYHLKALGEAYTAAFFGWKVQLGIRGDGELLWFSDVKTGDREWKDAHFDDINVDLTGYSQLKIEIFEIAVHSNILPVPGSCGVHAAAHDFKLEWVPLHNLTVKCTLTDGVTAVEGADVRVYDPQTGVTKYGTTNARGEAFFYDLEAATYEVSAAKGPEGGEKTVALDMDRTVAFPIFHPPEARLRTLTVWCYDEKENPLLGVTVTVDTLEKETDASGKTDFTLYEDEYDVVAALSGYRSASQHVVLQRDIVKNMILERLIYTLTVTVVDPEGVGIREARVLVAGVTEVTDPYGVTAFELKKGTYTVTASKDGYRSASKTVFLEKDTPIEITLSPVGVPPKVPWVPIFGLIAAGTITFFVVKRVRKR